MSDRITKPMVQNQLEQVGKLMSYEVIPNNMNPDDFKPHALYLENLPNTKYYNVCLSSEKVGCGDWFFRYESLTLRELYHVLWHVRESLWLMKNPGWLANPPIDDLTKTRNSSTQPIVI